jgi:hypothetical protein
LVSSLIQELGTLIYDGIGIVEGSNPYLEWGELELKTSSHVCLSVDAYIHRKRLPVLPNSGCGIADFEQITIIPGCYLVQSLVSRFCGAIALQRNEFLNKLLFCDMQLNDIECMYTCFVDHQVA